MDDHRAPLAGILRPPEGFEGFEGEHRMDDEHRSDADGPAPGAAEPTADATGAAGGSAPIGTRSSTPLVDWGAPPPDVKTKWTYEPPPGGPDST